MNLTTKEKAMLTAFIEESLDCSGCFLEDNMSWNNADDLKERLDWDKQTIGGVMASLLEKGLIGDSGESARGARINDFFAIESNPVCIALYQEIIA